MKQVLTAAAALAISSSTALAGGMERSTQSVGILFEEGTRAELSFSTVSPSVSGTSNPPFAAASSGDMAPNYQNYSFGYKQDIGENLDVAIILDQPVGANVAYPGTGADPYPFSGSTAVVDSTAVTGLVRYKFPSNYSVYGGVRVQSLSGDLNLIGSGLVAALNYSLSVSSDVQYGYVVGAAYERPDIALRVALTYNSEITHTFSDNGGTPFDVTIPQSVNLEFQSGVAKDTLVFGSVRWVEWTAFQINPLDFFAIAGGPIADGKSNTTSYTLGLGRRFSERWSGAVVLGYEANSGLSQGNLQPVDGYKSIGLAATYKVDNVEITGGVRYIDIGDTTTTTIGSNFADNDAIGVGVKVGVTF
ncbi:hypothetical protein ACFFUT_11430 [Pseudohalocynthiibacter aestuariivivens]|jgi:long-chain fatty acid transport protein|uniref:Transporter n=1 Tax=Pseudohalocynthiibacter aestuariivivens TaxID=1591409 RepID=A0ABV5JHS1_9RHOB|nr:MULTISPECIES: hypothetical protein [Pseudohalocynthiibacter]MBS9716274.1 hypothetical protein [Pseudohalocynthiibacter aestuariivivens]MCK0100918.1 hypothetical protein [Pseudohalocynthiibacter sp. F2068]